ncbi:MAG: hypothetical protein LBF58_01705 [Deltaproteobacteria bacterium]|jgi:hypothetical protein|nr:hypothetical protein [Deltaproteobacteria bacterium]
MNYEEIVEVVSKHLDYRNKLRLAQLLIQLARKEEEERSPNIFFKGNGKVAEIADQGGEEPMEAPKTAKAPPDLPTIIARILKSKPSRYDTLSNFIKAMFQFQGGINDESVRKIINAMCTKNIISLDNNKVTYL